MKDLLQYGVVQRVSLGIIITDMTGSLAQTLKKNFIRGIYVDSLIHAGAAMEAGLEKGDVISKIDNTDVVTTGQLQEILAEHRPGEKLNITIIRNDQIKNFVVTLKASEEDAMKNEAASDTELLKLLGIEAIPVSNEEKRRFHIKNGLKVVKIISGKIHEFTNMAIRKFFGEYFWHHFFEPYRRKGPLQASASGVIVTDDGYIITNNHVVEGAEVIDVVLHDQRT